MKIAGNMTGVGEAYIASACDYIIQQEQIPSLKKVADHLGLNPNYFQKIFVDHLGISPRDFGDALRQNRFKSLLKTGEPISQAAYGAGFGSLSRVYEFADLYMGMTPKAYQKGGWRQIIYYHIVICPLGYLLIAATERGLCAVCFGDDKAKLYSEFAQEFPAAIRVKTAIALKQWTQILIDYLSGAAPWPNLPYDVQATIFQRKVWDYLRTIPSGETRTYGAVAEAIGQPKAARAVARACATNPVALIIPCHRIIPKSGGLGGYRWDPKRKQVILCRERGEE